MHILIILVHAVWLACSWLVSPFSKWLSPLGASTLPYACYVCKNIMHLASLLPSTLLSHLQGARLASTQVWQLFRRGRSFGIYIVHSCIWHAFEKPGQLHVRGPPTAAFVSHPCKRPINAVCFAGPGTVPLQWLIDDILLTCLGRYTGPVCILQVQWDGQTPC